MDTAAITQLLGQAFSGQNAAQEQLLPLLYGQLREIAHRLRSREQHGHTLNTTALVHELYLGLFRNQLPDFESRQHFFHYAARAMRHLLIDHARAALAQKRGERGDLMDVAGLQLKDEGSAIQLLAMEQALNAITALSPRMAQVVELRFFAGLEEVEVAEILAVDVRTVRRDWQKARAHVMQHVQGLANQ
jgi:RNA polymerase sigma factor (TIGR02999 family)